MGRTHPKKWRSIIKILILVLFFSQNLLASVTFMQNCRAIEGDYLQFIIETSDTILKKNSSFALKITAFEDSNCKIPYLKFNQYFIVDNIQKESIDLKTEKVTYTALTEEVTQALRNINFCGLQKWSTSAETDVTGKMCDDFQQLTKADIFYQIIKNENNFLKFGNTTKSLDGRSHQRRPVQFDNLEYTITK